MRHSHERVHQSAGPQSIAAELGPGLQACGCRGARERALDRCGSGIPRDSTKPGRCYSDERQLLLPAVFLAATQNIPGYGPKYNFERTTHVRTARLGLIGTLVQKVLDSLLPEWQDSVAISLLMERESLAPVIARDDHDRAAFDPGSRFSPVVRRESSPCLPAARSGAAPPRLPDLPHHRELTGYVRNQRCHPRRQSTGVE